MGLKSFWKASREFLDSNVPGLSLARQAVREAKAGGNKSPMENEVNRQAGNVVAGATTAWVAPLIIGGLALIGSESERKAKTKRSRFKHRYRYKTRKRRKFKRPRFKRKRRGASRRRRRR